MGGLSSLFAMVVMKPKKEGELARLTHALLAPLVVWPSVEDSFSEMNGKARSARLVKLMKGDVSERASNYEIALYCSSFSLAIPPPSETVKVMMFAMRHAEVQKFGKTMDADPMLKGEGKHLSADAQRAYDRLAAWIYTVQAKAIKTTVAKRRAK